MTMEITTDINVFLRNIAESDSDIIVKGNVIYDIIGQKLMMYKHARSSDSRFDSIKAKVERVAMDMIGRTMEDIRSESRESNLVVARWLITYHLCQIEGYSTTQSGMVVCRDHATVLYGIKQINRVIENPNRHRALYDFLERFEQRLMV